MTTTRKPLLFSLNLSIAEKTALCELQLNNELARRKQRRTAHRLAKLHAKGYRERSQTAADTEGNQGNRTAELVAPDRWTARKYRKLANSLAPNSSRLKPLKELEPGRSLFSTAGFYSILNWITSARLFMLRLNRLTSFFHHSFLPWFFKLGGLSYAIELMVDIGTIFNATLLKPTAKHEQNLSFLAKTWQRFKLIMLKDDRLLRMTNAALWLSINLTCLFLTGGAYWILNLCGFSADIGLETIRGVKETWKYLKLNQKIKRQLTHCAAEIAAFENKYADPLQSITQEEIDAHLKNLEKVESLKEIKSALNKKIAWLVFKHTAQVLLTAAVLAGMIILIVNPVTTVPMATVLIGASLALLAGSIFSGLGKKIAAPVVSKTWDIAKSTWNRVFSHRTQPKPQAEFTYFPRNLVDVTPETPTSPPSSTAVVMITITANKDYSHDNSLNPIDVDLKEKRHLTIDSKGIPFKRNSTSSSASPTHVGSSAHSPDGECAFFEPSPKSFNEDDPSLAMHFAPQ